MKVTTKYNLYYKKKVSRNQDITYRICPLWMKGILNKILLIIVYNGQKNYKKNTMQKF